MADLTTTGSLFNKGEQRYAMIGVRVDEEALSRILRKIEAIPGAVERAAPAALNAAASETRTLLIDRFSTLMEFSRKKSVRDRVTIPRKASRGDWSTSVRISLSRFTIGSFKDVLQTPTGVTWDTGGDVWGAAFRGNHIPRAFVRKGLTHYKTEKYQETRMVFRRAMRGEKGFAVDGVNQAGHVVRATRRGDIVQRYSLKVLRGPSLGLVFSRSGQMQSETETAAAAILEKKLRQQIGRFLEDT